MVNENGQRYSDLMNKIRTEFRTFQLYEVLHKPPRALLGVTEPAEEALGKLDITTVFDLGTSTVFNNAAKIVAAGTDSRTPYALFGAATTDVIRETVTSGKRVDELQFLTIAALQIIPSTKSAEIAAALDVTTVRDLALYPPFTTARDLLNALFFPENEDDFDLERPADLLPRTGEYPTERVQYTTLLLDQINRPNESSLADLTATDFKPLDLAALRSADTGFQSVAFGALLTFSQSWYAQGVTLGQLLHSTSLAPGESTRVAVIDWTRRSRAGETETISEVDELTSDTRHNRAISEVTDAVATEAQNGFSHASTNSNTTQAGTSVAGELSAPLGGLLGGPSGSMGSSQSTAQTSSTADSYSASFGRRNVSSDTAQKIHDRTHQHASSSRSRRASVVKELAQSEHENTSTRVLANYNHMHALTIQYYEVVQIYRVEVALTKAERVIFIPVKLLDFTADDMIRRFRRTLARAALDFTIRETLQNLETVEIKPDDSSSFSALGAITVSDYLKTPLVSTTRAVHLARSVVDNPKPEVEGGLLRGASPYALVPMAQTVKDRLWDPEQAAKLSGLLNLPVLQKNSPSVFLPTDVLVEAAVVESGGAGITPVLTLHGGQSTSDVAADHPLNITDITRIALRGSSSERDVKATLTLTLNRNGVRFPLELPSVTISKGASRNTPLVTVRTGGVNANLKQHLSDNRLHYSQAVLRSLEATEIALLLSGFGVPIGDEVVPVAQVIDPLPIRYVGNYLAFTMSSDAARDKTWSTWLKDHGITVGEATYDVVPLGTGGTFAEAVLGRSNSAEKLDITRFWDWQDSPIPLQPTEIAAIQTGSRTTPEDTKPGSLSTPIINITTPTTLPDPVGTAAALQAVQNGSMFRDMSGLAATIGLAQANLQATSAGAASAAQQAGENMNNLLKANTERQRIAAEMITSLARTAASAYTGGAVPAGGGISGGSSSSQQGAKINYFDKTKGIDVPAAPATAGVPPSSVGGPNEAAPLNGSGPRDVPGLSTASYSQNPAALAATWGDSQPRSELVHDVLGWAAGATASGVGKPATPASPKSSSRYVVISVADGMSEKWAKNYTAKQPLQRHNVIIPAKPTPAQVLSSFRAAATAAGNEGVLIVNVGHGGLSKDKWSTMDGFLELAPNRHFTLGGPNISNATVNIFYNVSITNAGVPQINYDLQNPTQPGRRRLANWQIYQEIGKELRIAGISKVIALTCRVGNATEFLRKIANDWGVVVEAYKDRVALQEQANKRVRVFLESDPPGVGSNVSAGEEELPLATETNSYRVGPPSGIAYPSTYGGVIV